MTSLIFGIVIVGLIIWLSHVAKYYRENRNQELLCRQEEQRERDAEQHRIDWWKKTRLQIDKSFSSLPRPFDNCGINHPLNEKQIKLLYGLALGPKDGLRLDELRELWGDQSTGLGNSSFDRDWFGVFNKRNFNYRGDLEFHTEYDNFVMVDGPFFDSYSPKEKYQLRPAGLTCLEKHKIM